MPIRKILKIRNRIKTQLKEEMKEFEKKMARKRRVELETEILIAFIFVIISGWYIMERYGFEKLMDSLFFWMFPASIMIFLTLIAIFVIESMKRYR